MKIVISRCQHCSDVYNYLASGRNSNFSNSKANSEYCHVCQTAINEALSKIPLKFEKIEVEDSSVDLETLLKWKDEERKEKVNQEGLFKGLSLERVYPGKVKNDFSDSEVSFDVEGREDHKGKHFFVSYWREERKLSRLYVYMEKDVLSNKIIGYWRDI